MTERTLSRRAVVGGAALCGLAGALTACADDGPPAATTNPSATPSAAPTGQSTVLIATGDVPVGGGVLVDGQVLVVQPTAGDFKAFDPRCPHKGAMVAAPDASGEIICPLHKARFQANDGSRLSGPATTGLTAIPVEIVDGRVRRVAA